MEFSKSEAELVDVMDTCQHAISIIEKEIAKNPAFLLKEIDTGNTNSIRTALIRRKTSRSRAFASSVNDDEAYHRTDHRRFTRKHSRPRWDRTVLFLKVGTLKTVDDCSQHCRRLDARSREDCSDTQGQTRQHSKLINPPRNKQICIYVNKMD